MAKEVEVLYQDESFIDKILKNATWLVVALGLAVQFFYNTMIMDKAAIDLIQDWKIWVSTMFALFLHLIIIGSAIDKSIIDSLEHPDFKAADEKNDIIIGDIRNNQEAFYEYVKKLTAHEKRVAQETYLLNVGVLKVDDLTEEQLKEFNEVDYFRYDITNFTTPILYSKGKSKVIRFDANYDVDAQKKKGRYGKAASVILLSMLQVGITFAFENVLDAIFNLIITGSALLFSYFWNYAKPKFELLNKIPQAVKAKENLYKSFKAYQKGGIELKSEIKIDEVVDEVVDEETEIIE